MDSFYENSCLLARWWRVFTKIVVLNYFRKKSPSSCRILKGNIEHCHEMSWNKNYLLLKNWIISTARKSVRIWGLFGPYSVRMRENKDQKTSENENFSHSSYYNSFCWNHWKQIIFCLNFSPRFESHFQYYLRSAQHYENSAKIPVPLAQTGLRIISNHWRMLGG